MSLDVEDTLICVRLSCGEPVSVTVSDTMLAGAKVAFVESTEMVEEFDDPLVLDDAEMVVRISEARFEDLDDVLATIEDKT